MGKDNAPITGEDNSITTKKLWQAPEVFLISSDEIRSGDTQGTKEHYDDGLGHLYYS